MIESQQKIELYISCRNLKDKDVFSKSDPYALIYLKKGNPDQWISQGRTETLKDCLNPNFKTSFKVDYIFQIKQELKVEVRDDDGSSSEIIGSVPFQLGAVVGAKSNTLILDLMNKHNKPQGKVIIRCEKVVSSSQVLMMQWQGIKLKNVDGWFDKSDPFLRFNRVREDSTTVVVYETEAVMDNLNPCWKLFEITNQKLCNSDILRPIKLECWDWEKSQKFQVKQFLKQKFIGETEFTVNEIVQGKKEFPIFSKKKKQSGTLLLSQFSVIERPQFLDYIRGDTQLNFVLAVDFTGSNGAPNQPSSLHYTTTDSLNHYQKAIQEVGEILLNYDFDKRVPCYGFGAKPQYPHFKSAQALHCFPLTGKADDVEASGLQQIMDFYSYAVRNVELSGPTYFNPILVETLKIAQFNKQNGSTIYSILLILTDGEIHDMTGTIQSLVSASELPLSVIIVGIGNADFGPMEKLDGDSGLTDIQGRVATRDIVQFVAFNSFKGNPSLLAARVLEEIPRQLELYMSRQGILPRPPAMMNMSQVAVNVAPQQAPQQGYPPQAVYPPQQGYPPQPGQPPH